MAEEEQGNQSLKSSVTSSPGKGMHMDTSPEVQPERTYRFALNAMNESQEGDQGFLINEQGNYECGSLNTADWLVIGHVYTENDTAIVFLAPRRTSMIGLGRIIEVTDSCRVNIIMTSDCLNFSADYPIQAIYRIRRGCEKNIYFTDNNNSVRTINLDSLSDYLKEGQENYIADNPNTYQTQESIWDCEKMGMFPNMSIPDIHIEAVRDGGTEIKVGAYQFCVAYQDEDLNSTNFFEITNPIPITRDAIGSPGQEADAFDIQGAVAGVTTVKTIDLEFRNVDTSFAFLRLVCIPSTSGTGNIDGDVWEIGSIPITSSTFSFSFSGWNEIETPKLGLDDILIPSLVFETAKTIEQIDNRLVLGNISSSVTNWSGFQEAANQIAIKYYTYPLYSYSTHHGGPTSYRNYADYRTFMRDEVYALGIVWVFRNGEESPVFHIPGRQANCDANGASLPFNGVPGADPNNPDSVDHSAAAKLHFDNTVRGEHNRSPIQNGFNINDPDMGGWDTDPVLTSLGDGSIPGDANHINSMSKDCNTEHLVGYSSAKDDNIARTQRWNVFNTAIRTDYYWLTPEGGRSAGTGTITDSETLVTEGYMGYYECKDYDYPDKLNCDGVRVFPQGKIRHHRMPDTTLEPHYYGNPYRRVKANNAQAMTCVNTNPYSSSSPWQDPSANGAPFFNDNRPYSGNWGLGDRDDGPQIPLAADNYLVERVISLGVKALNVTIPPGMQNRVQGFRIVRGLPEETDRSVIDKGITIYNNYGTLTGNCQGDTGVENVGNKVNGHQPAIYEGANWEQSGGLTKGFRHGENSGVGNNNDWRTCVDRQITTLLRPISNYDFIDCTGNGNNKCMPFWFEATLGASHSGSAGTGTNYTLYNINDSRCFTEFDPWTGYPYPNLQCGYTTTGGMWNSDKFFSGGLFNIAYHGPLTKFNPTTVNAEYVKYERVLVGRVKIEKFDTHSACGGSNNSNCGNRPASWTYQYCDYSMSFIPAWDQGELFEGGAYDCDFYCANPGWVNTASNSTKGQYDRLPLVNRRIVAQGYIAAKNNTLKNLFSVDDFRNGYFQQEAYIFEVMNSVFDYDHYEDMTTNGNTHFKVGIPYPFYRYYINGCSEGKSQNVSSTRRMNPPADNTCYQVGDNNADNDLSKAWSGPGRLQSSTYYVSLKKNALNAFNDLSSIDYVATHNKLNRLGKDHVFPGLVDDPVDNGFITFGGDAFISKFAFRKTNHNNLCYNCDQSTGGRTGGQFHSSIVHYYVESYINCEYRHSAGTAEPGSSTSLSQLTTAEYDSHYPYWTLGNVNDGFGLFNGGFLDSEAKYELADGTMSFEQIPGNLIHINTYNINPDFNRSNTEKRHRSLPLTYDYCGVCYENFPTRIVYSQQSFKEEVSDNYRVFLAENYSDIPGHRGDITNLFVIGNTIFAHCNESLWRLHKSRQEVKTDNVSLRIGTGAFLAEPPQEMAEAEFGYLGSQSQWATLTTENGVFFVDSRQGRVYLLQGDKPVDLSNVGMRNFFENNLELELNEQYKRLTGEDFPLSDNPHTPSGVGFVATYDSRHTRYILTKKSKRCLDEAALLNGYRYINDLPEFDGSEPFLYLKQFGEEDSGYKKWAFRAEINGSESFVTDDDRLFQDTSFTISWNFSLGAWASFHSYKPNAYITFKNSFFSKINRHSPNNSINIYKHGLSPNGLNYTSYYSSQMVSPFVVDFIVTQNGITTFEYNNLHWISHASIYNPTTHTYSDQRYITFDHAMFYNSYQCSGHIKLLNKEAVPSSTTILSTFDSTLLGQVNLTRKERTFSMNAIRDSVIDRTQPLFTRDWGDNLYQNLHKTGYYNAVNSAAIGAKPWFETERFRDKYLGIRLIFSNFVGTDNCKLIFNYLYTQQTFTAR